MKNILECLCFIQDDYVFISLCAFVLFFVMCLFVLFITVNKVASHNFSFVDYYVLYVVL